MSAYAPLVSQASAEAGATGRSWGVTIVWVLVAAGLGVAAYWLWGWAGTAGATLGNGGWKALVGYPASVACGLGALVCLLGVFTASGLASCPHCGVAIRAFDATKGDGLMVFCASCSHHAVVADGKLRPVAPDHVHPRPAFATTVPDQLRWSACVHCGAAATRERIHVLQESQHMKNAAKSAVGVALLVVGGSGGVETGGGKVWRIPVPYCEQHDAGIAFRTDFGTPVVMFRSYAQFRAFCAAHGTEARDVPDDMTAASARSEAA